MLGARLAALRRQKKLSQQALALTAPFYGDF